MGLYAFSKIPCLSRYSLRNFMTTVNKILFDFLHIKYAPTEKVVISEKIDSIEF